MVEYTGVEVKRGVFKLEVEILELSVSMWWFLCELIELIETRNSFNGKHRKCGKTELEVGAQKGR